MYHVNLFRYRDLHVYVFYSLGQHSLSVSSESEHQTWPSYAVQRASHVDLAFEPAPGDHDFSSDQVVLDASMNR